MNQFQVIITPISLLLLLGFVHEPPEIDRVVPNNPINWILDDLLGTIHPTNIITSMDGMFVAMFEQGCSDVEELYVEMFTTERIGSVPCEQLFMKFKEQPSGVRLRKSLIHRPIDGLVGGAGTLLEPHRHIIHSSTDG